MKSLRKASTTADGRLTTDARERVVIFVCALGSIALGIVVAANPIELSAPLFTILLFGALAFVLPRAWLGIALIVLIPFQFYFPITESLHLRGALVFVAAATVRVLLGLSFVGQQSSVVRPPSFVLRLPSWLLPAALFIIAATISALGAPNRYLALKGILDWLPVFAAAFVISKTMRAEVNYYSPLLAVGVAEAVLGLVQTRFSPAQIAEALRIPQSAWFYQPNLLRERLADFSFNWVAGNRILPFGTFINGIDYALFLAAILALGAGLLVSGFTYRASRIALAASLALIGLALVLTYKGSGLLALAGAGALFVWMYGSRLCSARGWFVAIGGVGALVLVSAIFFEPLAQRATFLLQRETMESYETGRLEIWSQALAALPQRPLFGFGLNNAGQLVAPTQSLRGGTFIAIPNAPESAYVSALVETGLVGFAALVWFIGAMLVRAYQRARAARRYVGILAAIVALLCGNLTVAALTTDQNALLLGVLIGMVFADDERAPE